MAKEQKENFPNLPTKHWWLLREKFKSSIPSTISPGYVATALDMKESSAKANVLPALIRLGLLDDQFKPKDRAYNWRDDEKYSDVCTEIVEEVYPEELRTALPGPTLVRESVKRWFANRVKVGDNAATKMSIMYETLIEADFKKGEEFLKTLQNNDNKKISKPKTKVVSRPKVKESAKTVASKNKAKETGGARVNEDFSPSIHIDLQIHISPDASAEQIDKIFASMSKHIFKRKMTSNEN